MYESAYGIHRVAIRQHDQHGQYLESFEPMILDHYGWAGNNATTPDSPRDGGENNLLISLHNGRYEPAQ